jgi:hypothetical protein
MKTTPKVFTEEAARSRGRGHSCHPAPDPKPRPRMLVLQFPLRITSEAAAVVHQNSVHFIIPQLIHIIAD